MRIENIYPMLLPPEKEKWLMQNGFIYTRYSDFLIGFYRYVDGLTLPVSEDDFVIHDLLERAQNLPEDEVVLMSMSSRIGMPQSSDAEMYILTTNHGIYGAGVVLSDAAKRKMSDRFPDGFYLLPSSVHEWMVIGKEIDLTDLKGIVKSINNTDMITDDLYLADDPYEIVDGILRVATVLGFEGVEALI